MKGQVPDRLRGGTTRRNFCRRMTFQELGAYGAFWCARAKQTNQRSINDAVYHNSIYRSRGNRLDDFDSGSARQRDARGFARGSGQDRTQ